MNHIEVWRLDDEKAIEDTVNQYCRVWNLNPLSISVTYSQSTNLWIVAVVVEPQGGAE